MRRPLRILHCFRNPMGGIFRHVRDLTEAQVAAGHEVGMVCDSNTGGDYEARLFETIRPMLSLGIHRTAMQRHIGPGDLASAWRTYRIIKELRPDILHGHSAKGGIYARLFGSLLKAGGSRVARLYSPHGGSLHLAKASLNGRAVFAIEGLVDRLFTDHILFVSDHERRNFQTKVGGPYATWDRVYNGLRQSEFETEPTRDGAADILYIGMMRDLKGPDIFIDALPIAEKALGCPISVEMVGDGDDLPKYKEQVERLGLSARVRFQPAMPARQAFSLSQLLVVPSRAEAMPYIVLEALAAGKTMIATAVGGIPEIFGQGSKALLSPDPTEIGLRMVDALRDPIGFHQAMPDPASLRRRFSVETMAMSIEKAYYQALGERDDTSSERILVRA